MAKRPTILIVDDEPIAIDILQGRLEQGIYEFKSAGSGLEALAQVKEVKPDVILLDVMIPDMSGHEVCQRLKANKHWRHIPIILVTALGGKEDLARGLEAGADDFVQKPVNTIELRARVRSMLRIKKQYDALQAALRLREDLAHTIVHDMRTPLSVIMGYCDWLLVRETILPEDLEDIRKIKLQTNQLNRFLNDLLIMAKMEAEQLILNRLPVDINYIVPRLIQEYSIVVESKNIKIEVEGPTQSQQILLDANLFQRAIDNLISNAIKFSPRQSVITVQIEYPQSPETQLRIRVMDQGPGIAKEYRKRIFDKFEVTKLRRSDLSHVGLGLAFCKMVVEAHNGRIFVNNNHPAGSIFTIEI